MRCIVSHAILIINPLSVFFFFFNDTATTEIYTLSLHDALPISRCCHRGSPLGTMSLRLKIPNGGLLQPSLCGELLLSKTDRKSTRLNSSHLVISYAVFCLKKKKITTITIYPYHAAHRLCLH